MYKQLYPINVQAAIPHKCTSSYHKCTSSYHKCTSTIIESNTIELNTIRI